MGAPGIDPSPSVGLLLTTLRVTLEATISAEVRDPRTGSIEAAGYVGPAGQRIFTYSHLPGSTARAGLLVCPALLRDFLGNYRREVELARALAAREVGVYRFHHRGTGHSEGEWLDASVDRLCQDATTIVHQMREQLADVPIGALGTRVGVFVAAASVARQPPEAPLVLWDPVVDAKGYLRQALRAQGIKNLRQKSRHAPSGSELARALVETGSIDLLGYLLPHSLHEDMIAVELPEILGDTPRSVLIVTKGPAPRDASVLGAELEARGFDVAFESVETGDSWWFDPELMPVVGTEDTPAAPAIPVLSPYVEVTLRWLRRLDGEAGGVSA